MGAITVYKYQTNGAITAYKYQTNYIILPLFKVFKQKEALRITEIFIHLITLYNLVNNSIPPMIMDCLSLFLLTPGHKTSTEIR